MAKTARMMLRIEPEYHAELQRIGASMKPPATVSELMRQAVIEYIGRQRTFGIFTDRLMAVANGETLNQV